MIDQCDDHPKLQRCSQVILFPRCARQRRGKEPRVTTRYNALQLRAYLIHIFDVYLHVNISTYIFPGERRGDRTDFLNERDSPREQERAIRVSVRFHGHNRIKICQFATRYKF